ncbi:hypothetical protein FACS1894104_5340 [Actinomycetota bacterium]|nr:hypothetical protein FACS1894104_5340 [Actinomycetota bacterium]
MEIAYPSLSSQPATKTVIQYTSFIPEASIEFLSSNHPQNINPTSAYATTNSGTIGIWNIADQSGNLVLKGQGNNTGGALAGLPSGEYTIYWQITSSTTEQSNPALMYREFTVK